MRGWHAVVSSEGALGPMEQVYPDSAQVAKRLHELFGDEDLRVIMYLRPHHEWAASAYAQYVRSGGSSQARDFVAALLERQYMRHTTLVEDVRSNLKSGQLVVRPYRTGMDVVTDFFDVAGLGPMPPYLGHQRANESPPAAELEALRRENEAGTLAATLPRPSRSASASVVKPSPLPEDCQVDLQALFVTDWTELSAVVARLPGHRPSEFLLEVDSARDWIPQPWVQTHRSLRMDAREDAPAAASTPAEAGMAERLQRWEFRLRHGPRQLLLKSLTNVG